MDPLCVFVCVCLYVCVCRSRSFGDLIAASVGVIARPEIMEREVTDADAFVILASDGVWEFISNQEVRHTEQAHYAIIDTAHLLDHSHSPLDPLFC